MNKHLSTLLLAALALLLGAMFLFAGLNAPSHPSSANWLGLGAINLAIFGLLAWRFHFLRESKRTT
ncbi:hypothetical protein [Pseudomonas reactans]|uniref:hypothetical protein n=1 Tax=Pseudomonas reactans TaxID=117680 RepID=UPI0015A29C1A|nr:hypothetical protein [Pseudomonas reactans]NWC90001.1 hypothetical protein [Pseudomonas reactans]